MSIQKRFGRRSDADGSEEPGPLLFKGETALRKCMFGKMGRFSQDIDMDAAHENGFEAAIEAVFSEGRPFHGIAFSISHSPSFRAAFH